MVAQVKRFVALVLAVFQLPHGNAAPLAEPHHHLLTGQALKVGFIVPGFFVRGKVAVVRPLGVVAQPLV